MRGLGGLNVVFLLTKWGASWGTGAGSLCCWLVRSVYDVSWVGIFASELLAVGRMHVCGAAFQARWGGGMHGARLRACARGAECRVRGRVDRWAEL